MGHGKAQSISLHTLSSKVILSDPVTELWLYGSIGAIYFEIKCSLNSRTKNRCIVIRLYWAASDWSWRMISRGCVLMEDETTLEH